MNMIDTPLAQTAVIVQSILDQIIPVVHDPRCDYTLRCNLAALLGAMSIRAAPTVAPHLSDFLRHWCQFLSDFDRDGSVGEQWANMSSERLLALRGLVMAVEANGLRFIEKADHLKCLVSMCVAAVDVIDMERDTQSHNTDCGGSPAGPTHNQCPHLSKVLEACLTVGGAGQYEASCSEMRPRDKSVAMNFLTSHR